MLSQAWLFVFFFGESFADCLSDAIYTVRIYEIGQTVVIFLWRTEVGNYYLTSVCGGFKCHHAHSLVDAGQGKDLCTTVMVKQHLIAYPANVGDVVIVVYHAVQPLPFSIGAQVSSQHQLELIFMCGTDESLHILPLVCQQTGMKAKVLLSGITVGGSTL